MALGEKIDRMVHAMRFIVVCGLAALLMACGEADNAPRVIVETAQGIEHKFSIELANTDETRAIGLMNRSVLPENHGMLFDFHQPQEVTMWMKNTLISLDMLFIKSDGRIARIEHKTEPLSTRIIYSGDLVRYVLEISGGVAEAKGIKPGDRVSLQVKR